MKMQDVKQNAPHDATHYSKDGNYVCYFQVEDGVALYMSVNGGKWFDCTDADFSWELETGEIRQIHQ